MFTKLTDLNGDAIYAPREILVTPVKIDGKIVGSSIHYGTTTVRVKETPCEVVKACSCDGGDDEPAAPADKPGDKPVSADNAEKPAAEK